MIGRFGLRRRDYDFPPFRPPSEANSLLLRVTRGCPWNRCSFCSMYKTMKFEIRDLEEIRSDIETARDLSNLIPLHGKFPEEKEKMIEKVDEALKKVGENILFREELELRRHLINL
jgi:hypothetical protein